MQFTPKKPVKKFQQGGQMAPEEQMPAEQMPAEGAPEAAPEGGMEENPLVMLEEGAMLALQNQDCQMAMQVCQGLVLILQQMQEPAPEAPAGEPVFRKGGVLLRRVKK